MNDLWLASIPRIILILAAVALYSVALVAVIRKPKKLPERPFDDNAHSVLEYSGPEKRVYPRVKLCVPIRYKLVGKINPLQSFNEGIARDISEGGLLLDTAERFSVDDKLEFKLKMPSASHFMLFRGTIVWVKETAVNEWYSHGVSILVIDPNDRKQIARYVADQKCP